MTTNQTVPHRGMIGHLVAMPEHATTLRAFRQLAGGTAELVCTSTTTTVSVVAAGPLSPGVTYEFWIVGHTSQGDGPESNHVTYTVPGGPQKADLDAIGDIIKDSFPPFQDLDTFGVWGTDYLRLLCKVRVNPRV